MAKAKEVKDTELTKKAISWGDWLTQIGSLLTPQNIPAGMSRKCFALALLYSQNKVIDRIVFKGEIIFIVEK